MSRVVAVAVGRLHHHRGGGGPGPQSGRDREARGQDQRPRPEGVGAAPQTKGNITYATHDVIQTTYNYCCCSKLEEHTYFCIVTVFEPCFLFHFEIILVGVAMFDWTLFSGKKTLEIPLPAL